MLPVTITTEGLSKRFNREWIFRNFTYEFKPGNIYAITGPNGSGKSTLLSILWGQVPPTSGHLNYSREGSSPMAIELVYQYISIATPYMELIEDFTLSEMLNFHFKLRKVRNNKSHAELLDILYLADSRDKFIRNFSSGMKQRLKLGLAFFTEAPVIFLDEPGSHLDTTAFQWYREQLLTVGNDALIFVGSNDPQEYQTVASNVIDLRNYKK
ncbi:MAG TPA: ATP-binding cassette domain-containing protein [Chryseosolibacter sp.]